MKKFKFFVIILSMCLHGSVYATTEYVPQKPNINTTQTTPTEKCEDATYVPRKPVNNLDTSINSVRDFSPILSGHDWYVFDHVGYKDSAYQGERHIAYFQEEGGVQFYGYDKEALADLMLLKHPDGQDQTISILQAPLRADWHTLDGNGILFAVETVKIPPAPGDYGTVNTDNLVINGYAAVATMDEIQIRKYTNAKVSTMSKDFEVIYSEPKECPSVDFLVEITGNKAKVNLGSRTLKEITLDTSARANGILVCYAEHNCQSLSSVYTYSYIVNDIEYLKAKQ